MLLYSGKHKSTIDHLPLTYAQNITNPVLKKPSQNIFSKKIINLFKILFRWLKITSVSHKIKGIF